MGLLKYIFLVVLFSLVSLACQSAPETSQTVEPPAAEMSPAATPEPQPTAVPAPVIPNLQTELLDERFRTTTSPIGGFDFKNYTYELPRGWQNPDGSTEIKLVNGRIPRIERDVSEKMDDESKAEAKSQRRIGMSFVTARFFDVTGDGQDEAIIINKIETGGSAIPQVAYVFTWKDGKPELIWPFRTGDRADGGLKDIRPENGYVVVELYGQDRFLLGQIETGKIGDDIEQLCCPTHFTRTMYKWNGKNFLMDKKRWTYLVADPTAPPIENMGEQKNAKTKGGSKK